MKRICLICVVAFFGVCSAAAQDPTDFAKGFRPYSSYNTANFDSVNLQNGNLVVQIPLISYPQRGNVPDLSFSYLWNGLSWVNDCVTEDDYTCYWAPANTLNSSIALDGALTGGETLLYSDPYISLYVFKVYESNGSPHTAGVTGTNTYETIDATGMRGEWSGSGSTWSQTITSRDGIKYISNNSIPYYGGPNSIADPNGNTITLNGGSCTGWFDTIGRCVPNLTYNYGAYNGLCQTTYFPGPPGHTSVPIELCYSNVSISTSIGGGPCGLSGTVEYSNTWVMLSSITLPNGQSWSFTYDGYGEISTVTLPTGGTVTYSWGHTKGNVGCGFDPQVTQRALSGVTTPWTYSYSYTDGTQTAGTTTVTDPDSETTVHTFSGLELETDTQYKNAGGTLVKEVSTDYSFVGSNPFIADGDNVFYYGVTPKHVTTIWPNGQESAVCTTFDGNGATSCGTDSYSTSGPTFYDDNVGSTPVYPLIYGSQIYKFEYDYGTSSPATSASRKSVSDYQWLHSSYYLGTNLLSLPYSVNIYDGSSTQAAETTYAFDESSYAPSGCSSTAPCGLLTTTAHYTNSSTHLDTHTAYSSYGMPAVQTDAKGNITCDTYDSTHAYLSEIQQPNPSSGSSCSGVLLDYYSYDSNTGLLTSHTDPNSQTTSYGYDSSRRLTSVTYPDGGSDSYSYTDTTPDPYFTFTKAISSGANFVDTGIVDGFGRKIHTQLNSDPAGTDSTDYAYDGEGRLYSVSNPHRSGSSSTDGTTYYSYDALNRMRTVTEPDSSAVTTSYAGNTSTSPPTYCATVTDEASKVRQSCADGLGRTTGVWEDPGSSNYETDYAYNTLDNLTGVTQKGGASSGYWRTRTFTYDWVSRLVCAANPEIQAVTCPASSTSSFPAGSVQFGYDANGNVTSKTAPEENQTSASTTVTTTYSYDALNRMTYASYSDGTQPKDYTYDTCSFCTASINNGLGRLVQTSNEVNAGSAFSYDVMGRIVYKSNCVPVNCPNDAVYPIVAAYDLAGDMTSITYPSGRKVTYQYNNAMQPTQVRFDSFGGTSVGYNYISSASYAPTGAPTSVTLGSGVTETSAYNSRLQPTGQQVADGLLPWLNHSYTYGTTGHNNGNVSIITDSLQSNRTQTFTYDNLNRITQGSTTGTSGAGCFGESYTTDPWGNLSGISGISGYSTCVQDNLSVSVGTNNQFTTSGFSYDAAGNLLGDGVNSYTYDAESRVKTFDSTAAAYIYGPGGERVEKQIGGGTLVYTEFNGQPVAELQGDGDWTDYIYAGGKRLVQATDFEYALTIQGTNCSSCGWQYASFSFPDVAGSYGISYTVHSGDHLFLKQYQASGSHGGMIICFSDSTCTPGSTYDQDSQPLEDDGEQEVVHFREVDLSAFASKTIGSVFLFCDGDTAAGTWDIVYEDIVLVGADGTVMPIFVTDQTSVSLGVTSTSGISSISDSPVHYTDRAIYPQNTTTYYHSDQLGSARLLTNWYGYPTWSGTFAPYGMELSPEFTVNNYKFTGKERDAESGLDNFGARYDSSQYARFMTPDPANASADPANPQSWNMYSYVINNPINAIDPTGLCSIKPSDADATDDPGEPCVAPGGTEVLVSATSDNQDTTGNYEFISKSGWTESVPPGSSSGQSQTPAPNSGTQPDKNSCAARLAKGVQQHTGTSTSDPVFTQTRGGHANYGFTVDDPATFQNILNQNPPWSLPFGLDTGHRYGAVQSTHILDPGAPGAPYTGHTDLFNGHSVLAPLHLLIDVAIGHIPGVNLDLGCHQ